MKPKRTDPQENTMKKLILGTLAALIATASLSSVAEAGWRHHGWRGHWGYWGGPRIVIRPAYYNNYCFVKKIREYDDYGNLYIRRVRVCN
jgi:hypothetical protein